MSALETTSDDSIKAVSYEKAVKISIKSVRFFFIITGLANFLYSSRTAVWIEYAKTFDDFSHIAVSLVLYLDSILIGIVGTFFASLADYIGFDKSITYKIVLICIGCIVEAFATNFKLLCLGFIISQTATQYVAAGYIAWILPKKRAKTQISLMYAVIGAFYLLGPLLSGILYKTCNNYKIIFVSNAIIMTVLLLLSVICLYGKQKQLQLVQIASCSEMVENTPHAQDQLFPSYIAYKKAERAADTPNNDKMSAFQWYVIINILIEYGLLCFSAVFITFYLPFIIRKYPNNDKPNYNLVLVGSMQIVVVSLSGMISAVFISKYTHLYNKYTISNPHLLLIIAVILFNISCVLLLTNNYPIAHVSYWIYCILIGIFVPFPHLILEFLLIELQPPQHAGKINGLKAMILNIIRGLYLLLIGLLWHVTLHAILYVVSFGCVIIVILHCFMWILQKYNKQETRNKKQMVLWFKSLFCD